MPSRPNLEFKIPILTLLKDNNNPIFINQGPEANSIFLLNTNIEFCQDHLVSFSNLAMSDSKVVDAKTNIEALYNDACLLF